MIKKRVPLILIFTFLLTLSIATAQIGAVDTIEVTQPADRDNIEENAFDIAISPDGYIAVVWEREDNAIRISMYDPNGNVILDDDPVPSCISGKQRNPSVAWGEITSGEQRAVVVWETEATLAAGTNNRVNCDTMYGNHNYFAIAARIYREDGRVLEQIIEESDDGEFVVTTGTAKDHRHPDVVVSDDGTIIVGYHSLEYNAIGTTVIDSNPYVKRFTISTGQLQGGAIALPVDTSFDGRFIDLAIGTIEGQDAFLATWRREIEIGGAPNEFDYPVRAFKVSDGIALTPGHVMSTDSNDRNFHSNFRSYVVQHESTGDVILMWEHEDELDAAKDGVRYTVFDGTNDLVRLNNGLQLFPADGSAAINCNYLTDAESIGDGVILGLAATNSESPFVALDVDEGSISAPCPGVDKISSPLLIDIVPQYIKFNPGGAERISNLETLELIDPRLNDGSRYRISANNDNYLTGYKSGEDKIILKLWDDSDPPQQVNFDELTIISEPIECIFNSDCPVGQDCEPSGGGSNVCVPETDLCPVAVRGCDCPDSNGVTNGYVDSDIDNLGDSTLGFLDYGEFYCTSQEGDPGLFGIGTVDPALLTCDNGAGVWYNEDGGVGYELADGTYSEGTSCPLGTEAFPNEMTTDLCDDGLDNEGDNFVDFLGGCVDNLGALGPVGDMIVCSDYAATPEDCQSTCEGAGGTYLLADPDCSVASDSESVPNIASVLCGSDFTLFRGNAVDYNGKIITLNDVSSTGVATVFVDTFSDDIAEGATGTINGIDITIVSSNYDIVASSRSAVLRVECTSECFDGLDNDNDGYVDSLDTGCIQSGDFETSRCGDYRDNDNDGRMDVLFSCDEDGDRASEYFCVCDQNGNGIADLLDVSLFQDPNECADVGGTFACGPLGVNPAYDPLNPFNVAGFTDCTAPGERLYYPDPECSTDGNLINGVAGDDSERDAGVQTFVPPSLPVPAPALQRAGVWSNVLFFLFGI